MGGCLSGSSDKRTALETNKCSTCNLEEFEKRVNPLIDNIKLSKYKRNILKKRYTKLVIYYENYAENVRRKYNLCRIVISIGSMILPTLQTIQNNETVSAYKDEIFWAAIGTSLGVMIANNLISMFSLDRRYIMYAVTAEKLKAVGWKYFELSDMFSNKSHLENWIPFWNEVEKIKKLQVVAEFTDNDDKHHEPTPITDNTKLDTDSEYDSDSPRGRDTPRKPKTPRNNKDFEEENVVINLEEQRQKRIKNAELTFNTNYNNLKGNLKDNLDNTENKIKSLEIPIDNIYEEKKDIEKVFNNLENTLVNNLKDNNVDKIDINIDKVDNNVDIKKDN
mgnify:CR=1 FL=1